MGYRRPMQISNLHSISRGVGCEGGLKQYLPRTLVNSGVGMVGSAPGQSVYPTARRLEPVLYSLIRPRQGLHQTYLLTMPYWNSTTTAVTKKEPKDKKEKEEMEMQRGPWESAKIGRIAPPCSSPTQVAPRASPWPIFKMGLL